MSRCSRPRSSSTKRPPKREEMLTVAELAGLWHGDDLSAGFQHGELVVAICEQARPRDVTCLLRLLYPSVAPNLVEEEARVIVEDGFRVWRLREKLAA